ncbi:MAG: hypothetical protein ACE5LU_04000 [Anaerolineae bacterium]
MSNNVLLAAIGGFLLGWLIEWLIDLFYWRRRAGEREDRISGLQASLSEKEQGLLDLQARLQEHAANVQGLRDQVSQGEAAIRDLTGQIEDRDQTISWLESAVSERDRQIEGLRVRARETEARADGLEASLQEKGRKLAALRAELEKSADAVERDDLKVIHGIGRVYEAELHNAGIYTYEQMAKATPEQIRDILSVSKRSRRSAPESWIEEAKRLAEKTVS